jgi:hypothetical protein
MRRGDRRKCSFDDGRNKRLDELAADEFDGHAACQNRLAEMPAKRAIVMLIARYVYRMRIFARGVRSRMIVGMRARAVFVCAMSDRLLSSDRLAVRMAQRTDDPIDRLQSDTSRDEEDVEATHHPQDMTTQKPVILNVTDLRATIKWN